MRPGHCHGLCCGHDLTGTAAGLYWKNLVPECAERTLMRKNKTWRNGYVLEKSGVEGGDVDGLRAFLAEKLGKPVPYLDL